MNPIWHIQMLGGLQVSRKEGGALKVITRFHSRNTSALLAELAFYLHCAHGREELIEHYWPDSEPGRGHGNLSTCLSDLRRRLEPPGVARPGDVIVADRPTVRLNPQSVTTDVAAFRGALDAAAHASTPQARLCFLQEAADSYGGALLPGYYDDWVLKERERLSEEFFECVRRLASLREQAGELGPAIHLIRRALSLDPPREEKHEGREEAEENLQRLLVQAGPDARSLENAPAPAPLFEAAPPADTDGLPSPLDRFFGREEEMARLEALLGDPDTRLVTLTGSAGNGKSRLAKETARRLARGMFAGAIWFVFLEDLSEASQLPDAVLGALGKPRSPTVEPREQVVAALPRRPALLVLDTFEHLVEEGAPLVQELLARVPALTCLITSRRALNLSAERQLPVHPLPTPPGVDGVQTTLSPEQLNTFASVRMFVDRAQMVQPDFQITGANASAVAELMRRLEGIPLAIDLAAAWSQVLPPARMLAHLRNRFRLLGGRRRAVDTRHRTLRAALDWSYELLTPLLRDFFARLSVFRGGWTEEAAEAVCDEPLALDYLAQLRECSLILAEENAGGMRYRMLETLREYGRERLQEGGELAEARRRHLDWCLALAERAEPELEGGQQAEWLARLEQEQDNLRAALRRALSSDPEASLRLAGSLGRFFVVKGYWTEGRAALSSALERWPYRSLPWAKATLWAGRLARRQGEYLRAQDLLKESLDAQRELGDRQGEAGSLQSLGMVALCQGDYAEARRLHAKSRRIRSELEDRQGVVSSLNNLGAVAFCQGGYIEARRLCRESLRIARSSGDAQGIALALLLLGMVARCEGDPDGARALQEQSLAMERAVGDEQGIALALNDQGIAACEQGDYTAARALLEKSLAFFAEMGDKLSIVGSLNRIARLAMAQEQATRAARLLGAAETLRESIGWSLPLTEREGHERAAAAARADLGEEAYAAAWAEGCALTLAQAIACAREDLP